VGLCVAGLAASRGFGKPGAAPRGGRPNNKISKSIDCCGGNKSAMTKIKKGSRPPLVQISDADF